ncbi:glycosyltransferase [Anaerostipes hadrus]|uniref:glycosyltransferase n=1 Tax=Anaerostipes sp. TaxID=1872530 RepID=UPI002097249E|nr:glycosyltransferase [Anaerostipes hadrus]
MKKILIVANNMEIGGAERALLGLLQAIDCSKYKVDLFLFRQEGPFMKFIPSKIHVLDENNKYSDLAVPIGNVLKKGHIGMLVGRILGKHKAKQFIKKNSLSVSNSVEIHYSYRYTKKYLPRITEEVYDLALGFTVPYYIVDEKVKAKKKAVWLHTDYSKLDGDTIEERKVWSAYDYIVSISEEVTKAFLTKFKDLKEKIVLIENIVSKELIQKQANEIDVKDEMRSESGFTKLLSIGRFTIAKNFDNIPDICSRIIEKGQNVRWYIIGFGSDEELIKNKIKEFGMEKNVILLGKKENPYPYIKECDIYVQPSRFEGKAVTVREAQILQKPVVITDFSTAKSQITDGVDGVIVPLDNQGCADAISDLILDIEKQKKLIDNCKNGNYDNLSEVNKIYNLID